MTSLPLHMQSLGAAPATIGAATSCFSAAQMVVCPILVAMSGRLGRQNILRVCLAGAAASNMMIAVASTPAQIIFGRTWAGVFAASTPVAQAASADIVKGEQTARALSRVSASAQMGVVIGPMVVAFLATLYGRMGMVPYLATRAVYATSSIFALSVLALTVAMDPGEGGQGTGQAAQGGVGGRTAPMDKAEVDAYVAKVKVEVDAIAKVRQDLKFSRKIDTDDATLALALTPEESTTHQPTSSPITGRGGVGVRKLKAKKKRGNKAKKIHSDA